MGKAITYCVECSKRVTDSDLEAGKAFRVGDRILCKACAPDIVKTQTTKKVARPSAGGTSVALKAQKLPPAPPPQPAAPPPDRKKLFLIAGAAGAAVVLILILVLSLRKGDPPPNPAKTVDDSKSTSTTPSTSTSTTTGTSVDPKAAAAKADLDKARVFAKAHPSEPAARLKEFTEIVWKWDGTDAAAEAAKEAAAVKAEILEIVKGWMAEVETQIQPLLAKEEFYDAAKKVESLKPTHDLPEWRLAAEKRASELYVEARRRKDLAEAKKDAEKPEPAEKDPRPVEKLPSEEAKGYRSKWVAAAASASARDFAGAAAQIERAAASIKEADVLAEAKQDADDFKRVAALRTAALDALKKKPRGAGLSVAVRQSSGEVKRVAGMILQIDAQRVECQAGKATLFVEWEDVAASGLAEAGQELKADPRTLAQVCLLEGETAAAKAYGAELDAKWWDYAAGATSKVPPPDPSERAVRELYYTAEKNFRSMETRPAAIENYRTLKSDYGSTSLVKGYAERIARRAEAGKEYYFAPQEIRTEGTLRLAKSGKIESTKDSDEQDTLQNAAEVEFAALTGVPYRCWAWVGACCEETFLFYLQGTEFTDTDPKTKKKVPCEPGSTAATPIKLSLRGLKKTHEEHRPKGAKVNPKTAARWEWIEIPLPRYASPGAKKVRIMTHHAGFSVGGIVVSATRKAAPVEAELKDLEKDREPRETPPADPDLLAWWTFDEGGGMVAVDRTGKGHDAKVVGEVKWGEGKVGGGVRFASPGRMLEGADAEDLRLPGDLTMALWMKKEGEAGDWSCLLGKGEGRERNYCLWLEGNTRMVMFQQFGDAAVNLKTTRLVEDNVWTHVAATVEGGKATIYVNGVKDGEEARKGAASAKPSPFGMGWAVDHGTFRGSLDDVRIYRRALSADEVRALYEQSR